jgi:two-component system sensor histidine kinase UhpB
MIWDIDYTHKTKRHLIEEIELLRSRICQLENYGKETGVNVDLSKDFKYQQQAILNNIPDIAWLKNKECRYIAVNKPFANACGMEPEELTGRSDQDIWPRKHADKCRSDDLKVMKAGISMRFDDPFTDKNGRTIWIESIKTPVFNDRGEVIGTTGIARDVTERKKIEEKLQRSQEQLRNLYAHLHALHEQERSRISRDINEELNQILSVFKFDLNWIDIRLQKNQQALKKKIKSMSDMITSVIEWIRRLSQELRPSLLDHLGIIPAIEWELAEFENRTGIVCSLKAAPTDIKLNEKTSTLLFRILQEALSNIKEHSQASKSAIRLERKNGWIKLEIKDNGIGIANEKLSDSGSIGLSGIQELIRPLKGNVEIRGSLNKGTTLTVKLPDHLGGN